MLHYTFSHLSMFSLRAARSLEVILTHLASVIDLINSFTLFFLGGMVRKFGKISAQKQKLRAQNTAVLALQGNHVN